MLHLLRKQNLLMEALADPLEPGEGERIYAQSINRYAVMYRVPGQREPGDGRIQITSESGCGRASFSFAGA